jgi:gluconate 5-dehydrogenase
VRGGRSGGTLRVQELFDLAGRTALVTGGGRGLGRHLALGLAEAGADVVVASRKLEACAETTRALEALGRRAWALRADLGRVEDAVALAREAAERAGPIDVLVNNAAFAWGAPLLEHSAEGWDRVFGLNVRGLFFLSQAVARGMIEAGRGGSIVHVSSIAALRGAPDAEEPAVAYAASKGAVNALTRDMAVKLAPHRIRVNALAPGPFDTAMLEHVKRDPERQRRFLARLPLRRVGGEDDVKGAVVFLASAASAYVTGHVLVVDGGWSVQTS